ncbi:MAG: hypothetical protein R2867_10095 [Caldilineaceae bacterium]
MNFDDWKAQTHARLQTLAANIRTLSPGALYGALYRPIAEAVIQEAAKAGKPLRFFIDGSKIGNDHQLLMVTNGLVDRPDRHDLSIFRIGFDMLECCFVNGHSVSIRLIPYFL